MSRFRMVLLLLGGVALAAGCQSVPVQGEAAGARPANQLALLHTQLGAGYIREGQYERANDRLQRALEADPGYAPAHNAMALLSERLDNTAKAEHHYRQAIQLNPKDSKARNNYGGFLCRQERYEEAMAQFDRALENRLYGAPEAAYANAGLCLQRAGRLEEAARYLREALEINPRIPAALLAMGEISMARGEALSARGYLQRYQEVGPRSPQSLWLGIRIERELGDRDAVSSYAMLLKNNYPDSRETQLLLESEAR